ncbi:talin-2 isoform X1 [Bombyx mori]|uniref:FERM domain-containing protein n=1 Tax=Bombyx mori TaxID=7091 RepID=A0A8R2R9E2_BOMMO|nr:talin-2 isoform X1 [Bombyx mori]
MAPISIKIIMDDGAVTRKVKFDSTLSVAKAHEIVKEKFNLPADSKDYGLFLRSADNDVSGVWLDYNRNLDYYMLRDGDTLDYLPKERLLKVKILDGTVKTLKLDQSKQIGELMRVICGRIGITNHDEYGLCWMEDEKVENKPRSTGTLTAKTLQSGRDAQFEELSKKLHTDDNVKWLDHHKTLRELSLDETTPFLLKRKLFYSDKNVDERDPMQLNLLYLQTRDAILNLTHPVTEKEAIEFAGIQCQIHYGDYQEDRFKPGFISNMNEYLPSQYSGSWGVEKKIIKAYKKHQGLTPLHAKSLYIKTARDLPTFGVTFFLVKEKMKGKKKLIPRLLGINAESILRLDETTKEILQVWPLTHVKTYNVANAEAFILNFGEYSEEPYTVKTRDANQIRDILEGYIDLIGKKLLAKHNFSSSDRMIITEDEVAPSKLNTIQYIANNPNKIVEHSFVGPSKIISYENASECRQGTQIMTVQKILTMGQLQQQQHAVVGELPQRGDMSMDCIRKLNRLNSNSVKMVTFLTDPTDDNIRQAQDILRTINEDKPIIVDGLRKAAENQSNPEMTKKMLEDLQELEELLRSLNECMEPNKYKLSEADEAACRIADLSTQIYFSMDPRTRRRSDLLNRSRKSFIADEKMDKTLRRASFIAAATTTLHALNAAQNDIAKECGDLELTPVQQAQLQESTSENVRKLSAAVALYLMAHADPQMVDYQAAINSLNMIRELVPEIAKDSLAWKSMKDNEAAEGVVKDINSLCSMTSRLCTFTGPDDHEKMQEACNGYADVSRKLLCALGRGGNMDKEVEIIDLSKNVGDKSSNLLDTVDKLLGEVPDNDSSASKEVVDAKSRVAYCARDLLACAQLTAPSLHEPHCRSALMAASEALSSSVQHLALVWKPLVEDPSRNHHREALKHNSLLIARALDALKNAVGSLGDSESSDTGDDQKQRELRRLKFINSAAQAKKNLEDARNELNEPAICQLMREEDAARLQSGLADKLAQLNAAIAALISSTSDRDNPDYATADLAVGTISELLPQVVYDAKVLSSNKSPEDCKALLDSIRALCDASRSICESAEQGKSPSEGAVQFAEASEKLACGTDFNFNPDKENRIKDLVSEACASASQLLSKVQQLSETVGGDVGEQLDKEGIKVADATQNLITAAQLTAPLISNARCQSALLSSVDAVSGSSQQLQNCWRQLQHPHVVLLDHDRKLLEDKLDDIRKACQEDPKVPCEQHRLQFIRTLPSAKQNLQTAEDLIYKPVSKRVSSRDVPALEHRLQQSVARHNASVADLLAATADADNPDYERADAAIRSITETMPEMVEDARALSATGDETSRKALLDRIKALCEATKALCGSVEDSKEFKESAARLSEASQKLKFVFSSNKNPRNQQKEQEIMDLTSSACGAASQLLSKVQQMSVEVGGDAGERLDGAGTRVAETTKNMLTTAQLTAPSISDARCQSALLSSVDAVSGSSQQLQNCWRQLQHPHVVLLDHDHKLLEDKLDHIRKACQEDPKGPNEQQRLQFIRTLPSAKQNLQTAEDLIYKPVSKRVSSRDVPALEHRLQQSVARHNASVADLLAATADADNPDYERADAAIRSITETMPEMVEDAKALSATGDETSKKALLDRIKALCEATKALCGNVEDPKDFKESAARLSDASQKLKFVFSSNKNPRNQQKEQEIMDLTSSACGAASQLLSKVQQMSVEVGGDAGERLDGAGTRVAETTKNMLTTAQLTAPSISDARCQSALLSSVDAVSGSSQQLQNCWRQLQHPHVVLLDHDHKLLEDKLDHIRKACQEDPKGSSEQHRLQFIRTLPLAKQNLQTAEDLIYKPVSKRVSSRDVPALEHRLQQSVARHNASVADLLSATADGDNPDYERADAAIRSITEMMPEMVEDARALSATGDETSRKALLDRIKALCEATKALCGSVEDPKEFKEAAARLSEASQKLKFVFSSNNNPRNQQKEQEIMDLTSSACGAASQLLSKVQQMSVEVGGDAGERLDGAATRVAETTKNMLTTAQLTAPSISDARCQSALLSSVDAVSGSSQQLQNCWRQLQHPDVVQLNQDCKQLEDHLEHIRRACRIPIDDTTTEKQLPSRREQQRLKFIRTLPSARHNLQAAENLLNEPVNKRVSSRDVPSLEYRLQQSVARHNANVANLLAATADAENPDYERANEAIKNITETMPMIVEDAKALSCTQDGESRKALLERIKALCEATKSLCGYAEDPMELKESTSKLSDASQKLKFVFSSNRDPTSLQKEKKIIDLASSACGTASQMLSKVQQISDEIGGDAGMTLDVAGTRVVDSTKNMLTTAQLTAPSIEEPTCRSALLAAVDGVSNSSQELQDCWKQLRHPQIGVLDYEHKLLEDELEQIRVACQDADLQGPTKIPITEKPKVLQKPSSIKPGIATKPSLKANPLTGPVVKTGDGSVDKLRENQLNSPMATSHVQSSSVNADQEKLLERLKTTVDEANKKIRKVEDEIKQANEFGEVKPLLNISSSELSNKKKKMQDNLALASVQVASLVAVNYADKIDYETAQKSIKSLPQLTSDIVHDGILTSKTLKTDARKAFLDDMLNYCEATKQLCDTAKNDRGKINEAAIDFGDKSTKLLYSISCDADPALEKEIISRAKQIGDSASRLAMAAAHFAQDWSDGGVNLQNICDGGANCVDAVGKLVYTSKLVSPTINNKYSQEALITSADVVSEHLKTFSSVWKPLSSDPRQAKDVYKLNEEAQNLEKLLEDLRGDVKDGKIAKAREEEKLVIESSPLRQLSCEILSGALKSSECMELPVSMRQKYKDYAYNLKNALKDLDLANDRYRRAPYDTDRAIDLESAIENLKISLLQTRPKVNDAESSNVVDIRDFLQDLTIEADKLTERASEIHSECDHDNIEKIKENCHEISSKAFELMHEGNQDGEVLEQFGEECNDRIKTLRSVLEKCQDQKTKELEHRLEALEESCKLYWFAAKCNLSTARSAALDATLNDLNDIQRRVIKTLLPANEVQGAVTLRKRPPVPPKPQMKAKLSGAVAAAAKQAANSEQLAAAFTDYIADIASSDYGSNGEKRELLLAHLYKLVDLMKILSLTVNKRVATWQPVEDPEVSRITEQILREIENPESKFSAAESSAQNQLFSADNAYQMLLPNDKIKIIDEQKLNKKLHQYSSKLSGTCTDILQSLSQPSSLPQVLAGAVHSAAQLGDVARAHRNKDPVHNSRIEDAIQDLSFATYNVLKTAEYASRDLDHPVSRRRLLDALRQLNESINTLVRCCSPGPSSEMTRMKRHLQLQTSTSQFQHPTCGLPYLHCVDALNNQKDVLSKLKNEEAMPREELIKDLGYITSAVCNSSEYFQQCAYLMSISEQDLSAAKEGLVDIRKIQKSIGSVRDSCIRLIRTEHIDDIKEDIPKLKNQMKDLTQSLTEAQDKIKDEKLSKDLTQSKTEADSIFDAICRALDKNEETKIAPLTMDLMSVLKNTDNLIENPALIPTPKTLSVDTRQRCEEIYNSSKVLLGITQDLVDEVSRSPEEPEMMTWVMFGNSKKVLKAFDDLLKTVQINGQRAGIILGSPEDTSEISDSPVKSFLDTQLEIANKWLNKPTCKAATKSAGQKAAKTIIDVAEKMAEDMTPAEKLEWKQMFHETDVLLNDCCQRYDQEKYSIFSHRLKDLKKMIERGVVTRVVEDFMDQEEPLADLDILVDSEKDEKKRQYLLEKKIAELLAQLGRVTRTARFVADTGTGDQALTDQLKQCSNQTELLAPMLVKAAQERLAKPNDQAIIDNYKSMLAQYAESVSKVRDLCDQAVDPMEFVQTAGETMQRLREESALTNDTLKGAQTSYVISKLGGRVISVSMKSNDVRDDPELAAALRVLTAAAAPPRASRLPDWKDATAQILRTTGEVESMLGGEGIFKKQPEPDQPIYSVALDLHTAVRGWSSRDNEIVGVAKRMAVLMAKLSEYMNTDKKRNLLITSKKIVEESHEVAYLAKKLAGECTDVRIKTNLLNACERIPTISAQLKMLTTVKGSSLGRQGTEEDKEAMNMLVGNAQSLMLSIQDVVKAAASASVKIMSQTGPRIKWVRKTYY